MAVEHIASYEKRLQTLEQLGIERTPSLSRLIYNHANYQKLLSCLDNLKEMMPGDSWRGYIQPILDHRQRVPLLTALTHLFEKQIVTRDNCHIILEDLISKPRPMSLCRAILRLHRDNLDFLQEPLHSLFSTSTQPEALVLKGLIFNAFGLHRYKYITEYYQEILQHSDGAILIELLGLLVKVEWFSSENLEQLLKQDVISPHWLDLVNCFLKTDSLSSYTGFLFFQKLCRYSHILFGNAVLDTYWSSLVLKKLTQEDLEPIFDICQTMIEYGTSEIRAELKRYITSHLIPEVLVVPDIKVEAEVEEDKLKLTLNDSQSVHTASVNATTNLTTLLLLMKYEDKAKLSDEELDAFRQDLENYRFTDESEPMTRDQFRMINTALRGFDRVFDKNSKVVIEITDIDKKQVLDIIECSPFLKDNHECRALADSIKRESGEDASDPKKIKLDLCDFFALIRKEQLQQGADVSGFIHALESGMRSYSKGEKGEDDYSLPDIEMCWGGLANKLCECTTGISPLIHFVFANHVLVATKIKHLLLKSLRCEYEFLRQGYVRGCEQDAVIRHMTRHFVDDLSNPDTITAALESCWYQDKELIRDKLIEEFSVYIVIYGLPRLDKEILAFEEGVLPHLPPLSDKDYSQDTREWLAGCRLVVTEEDESVRRSGSALDLAVLTRAVSPPPRPQSSQPRLSWFYHASSDVHPVGEDLSPSL